MRIKIKRPIKRLLEYIYIPVILAAAGLVSLYAALGPVFDMASGIAGIIISDSAPKFDTQLSSIYDDTLKPASDGSVNMKDIEFPSYETCYARLECERLDMDVAVFWGDTDRVFREGAGQYIGSFIPGYGGIILLGAHDSMYFEPLEGVVKGDEFVIKTNYGIYTYKVSDTRIASGDDSEVYGRLSDKEQLVMYTCYPFGALIGIKDQRFYVFADLVSGPDIIKE